MNKENLKIATLLSYAVIIINSLYGILIMPYVIGKLGPSEYGVYKIVTSFSGSLLVLDLGINGTMIRFIAKYKAEKDEKRLSNFLAMGMIICLCMIGIVILAGGAIFSQLPRMYQSSLTGEEFVKLKEIFWLMVLSVCVTMVGNALNGMIGGCNAFVYGQSIQAGKLILRTIAVFVLLSFLQNSMIIVLIDIVLAITCDITYYYVVRRKLILRIKLYYWDKQVFYEAAKYTGWSFLQSIINQFNGNLDNMIIGSFLGTVAVSIYSIGLTFFTMFSSLASAISSLMLPTVTNIIHSGASNETLEDEVIKVGRFQFALLGAALAGFILVGKDFITLIYSEKYNTAWAISVILMIPAIFYLIVNVCLSILRAKGKMGFQTIMFACTAGVNFLITYFGVQYFGIVAAAVGTAFSLVVVKLIIMSIYYTKIIKLNMVRIYKGILHKTLICLVLASCPVIGLYKVWDELTWKCFLCKCLIFITVYGILMLAYGLEDNERILVNKVFNRVKRGGKCEK